MARPRVPAVLRGLLDALGYAVLVADAAGRVLHETPTMRALLEGEPEGEPLRAAIRGMLRASADGAEAEAGREVRAGDTRFVLRAARYESGRRAVPLVLVSLERAPAAPPSEEDLGERFGLTATEARVAILLGQGRSNAEVARALSISPHTARRHTERVMSKLGARSRAQVAGRLAR